MSDVIDQIRRTVMYEGYALYPYRPSIKNHLRWTFGVIFPRAYSDACHGTEPAMMQAQCLVLGGAATALRATVHFLHVIQRASHGPPVTAGGLRPTDQPSEVHTLLPSHAENTWQEAAELAVPVNQTLIAGLLAGPLKTPFAFPFQSEEDPVRAPALKRVRERQALEGSVELSAEPAGSGAFRVTLRVQNGSPLANPDRATREQAMLRAMVATHIVLRVHAGEFVSVIDPPPEHRSSACANIGCWPVLVGLPGDRSAMLAAPIILYDYPQLAPESPGDLFDATEMDEMLTLRLQTLTDGEREAMAETDARTRALLHRTDSLSGDQVLAMHGAIRGMHRALDNSTEALNPAADGTCRTQFRPGDQVRLRPRARADAFDSLLVGRSATIVAIERDFEDRLHLAVTIDDDPGAAEGRAGKIGHRFFFRPDEVEPVRPSGAGGSA